MNRKLPRHKTVWFGLYRKFWVFGAPMRTLESIHAERSEAEAALSAAVAEGIYEAKDYMIEEVDVIMHAWQP